MRHRRTRRRVEFIARPGSGSRNQRPCGSGFSFIQSAGRELLTVRDQHAHIGSRSRLSRHWSARHQHCPQPGHPPDLLRHRQDVGRSVLQLLFSSCRRHETRGRPEPASSEPRRPPAADSRDPQRRQPASRGWRPAAGGFCRRRTHRRRDEVPAAGRHRGRRLHLYTRHIAARGPHPDSYADCFAVLGDAGIVSSDLAQRLGRVARFRSRLVHLYWRIDNDRLWNTLRENLGDLEAYLTAIGELIEREGS